MPRNRKAPIKFCAIDCEGTADHNGFKGGVYVHDHGSEYITDHREFVESLRDIASRGYVFAAHNAEYDLSVILWTLRENCRIHYFNTSFNHAEWFYSPSHPPAHIWDTVKLSGGLTLAKVGEAVGLPKLATPKSLLPAVTDTPFWVCEKHKTFQCIECYALRDGEIVYAFLESYTSFMRSFNCEPKRTPASAAVAIWREIEQPAPLLMRENSMNIPARAAFFGGRTEPFKVGTVDGVYTADVVSMYPYVMLNKPMCVPRSVQENESKYLTDNWIKYEGVTECLVNVPPSYVPVLPCKVDGRLHFPYGRFRGTWVNAELRAAVQRGAEIVEIQRVLYSSDICYPFARFVASLMALREDYIRAGDPRHLTVKRILNSLYGRMGLSETQTEERIAIMPHNKSSADFPKCEVQLHNSVALLREEITRAGVNKWSNVLWAGSITAYARLRLLEFMELQGSNILYCDTDSVYSSAPIVGLGNGLGELKDEGNWDHGLFMGPKLYRLWNDDGFERVRAKGVRVQVAAAYLRGEAVSYEQPYRPRESASRGGVAGVWREITKQRRLVLGKRRYVNPSISALDSSLSDSEPVRVVWDSSLGRNVIRPE